jgi:hypothetical protein
MSRALLVGRRHLARLLVGRPAGAHVRGARGVASVEVLVLAPMLLFLATLVLQLGVAGWTASQTEEAARQSARAQSLGQDARGAAEGALPGALDVRTMSSGGDTVTLTVNVPRVSVLPTFTVTRQVSIPVTP